MSQGFLVVLENRSGKVKKGSLEALAAARGVANATGGPVTAIVFGAGDAASRAVRFGPDRLLQVFLEPEAASRDAWIEVLARFVSSLEPACVLASATAFGKDCLAGLAARFQSSLLQDVTEMTLEGGHLLLKRPVYAGKAFEVVRPLSQPVFITLRPNVFPALEREVATVVEEKRESLAGVALGAVIEAIRESAGGKIELTEANAIVSGGRGIKGPEHYPLIEKLAEVLGAATGASRAVVDAGWVDHQLQVGQTGKTVSPALYLAVGISGAIQHLAGMSTSKCIVAINKDADAPIFKVANYGLVGDLFKIVPLLIEELKAFQAN